MWLMYLPINLKYRSQNMQPKEIHKSSGEALLTASDGQKLRSFPLAKNVELHKLFLSPPEPSKQFCTDAKGVSLLLFLLKLKTCFSSFPK